VKEFLKVKPGLSISVDFLRILWYVILILLIPKPKDSNILLLVQRINPFLNSDALFLLPQKLQNKLPVLCPDLYIIALLDS